MSLLLIQAWSLIKFRRSLTFNNHLPLQDFFTGVVEFTWNSWYCWKQLWLQFHCILLDIERSGMFKSIHFLSSVRGRKYKFEVFRTVSIFCNHHLIKGMGVKVSILQDTHVRLYWLCIQKKEVLVNMLFTLSRIQRDLLWRIHHYRVNVFNERKVFTSMMWWSWCHIFAISNAMFCVVGPCLMCEERDWQ